jgi:hypothetical protein
MALAYFVGGGKGVLDGTTMGRTVPLDEIDHFLFSYCIQSV